ncbi:MAG: hypothetical protein ACK559_07575, partial [bacterium]
MAERAPQRPVEGPHGEARSDAEAGQEEEEHRPGHGRVEAADETGQVVPEKAREEPHAHHQRHDADRRHLRHQRQPHRREVELADGAEAGADARPVQAARAGAHQRAA